MMNTRLLGALGVLGALAGMAEGMRVVLGRGDPDTLTWLLSLVTAGGIICGILGLQALHVAGRGTAARVMFGVMLLAGLGQGLLALVGLVTGSAADPLPAIVGMVIVLGALIVGIMALRAGQPAGWRAYAPLAVPLTLVLTIVAGLAGAIQLALLLNSSAWLAIGYAVYSKRAEPRLNAVSTRA